MYTRIILGNDIWFVVDESMQQIVDKFNNNDATLTANVIDGYEISVIKEKIICFVSVNITEELNIPLLQDED
jgi:hypothetical protein